MVNWSVQIFDGRRNETQDIFDLQLEETDTDDIYFLVAKGHTTRQNFKIFRYKFSDGLTLQTVI